MNFKELYSLIFESPDTAEFQGIPIDGHKRRISKSYTENSYTFIILGGAIVYSETHNNYHGPLMRTVANYILDNKAILNGGALHTLGIKQIGNISESFLDEFRERGNREWNRTSLLQIYPEVIQGRAWAEKDCCLVSIWNDLKYFSLEERAITKRFTKEAFKTDNVYLEIENDESIPIDSPTNVNKPDPQNNFDINTVHLAPPEKKREMLLKQGARPKAPLDLKQRQAMMAESSKRSVRVDWDTLKYQFSETVNNEYKLTFFNKDGAVGYIEWDQDDGEVNKIYVGDIYRRQGVGRFIWDTAQEYAEQNKLTLPEHSSRRTEEGEHFAQSIGGYIPSLRDDIDGWSTR